MSNNTSKYRSGSSPFDQPKNFSQLKLNDYHLKKAKQLLNVKNYNLALKEYETLERLAIENNELNIEKDIKKNISEIKRVIETKNENRKKINKLDQKGLLLKNNILEFEEYSNLIRNSNIKTFDPLLLLVESAKKKVSQGEKPVFLFDLDSTLFDNSPRVLKIIKDFISEYKDKYPEITKKMATIERKDIVWGIRQNLENIGVKNKEIANIVFKYWLERFFSNEYIIDVPLKGGVDFVKDLEDAGASIMYLTGRYESIREGTSKNIREFDLPLDDKKHKLILKPSSEIPDHTFKHEALEMIKKESNIIAGFENEPINANIFQEHFPEAKIFFLETNHSMNPPNLLNTIHTIDNFEYK